MLLAVQHSAAEHVRALTKNVRLALLCQRVVGQTCLHMAVRMKAQKPSEPRLDIVRALLEAGGRVLANIQQRDLESRSRHGASALDIAAQGECLVTTQALLEVDSETLMMHCKKKGETCLHVGVAVGCIPVLQALLKAGGLRLAIVCDASGNTCLHIAACHGRLAVVDELVQLGGLELLAMRNNDGATCLFLAAQSGDAAV